MYRIGEFSKIVKLTVKTLRFYEDVGLFKPSLVDKFTGYRYYTNEQLFPLQQIVALRQAGFSVLEIKNILSGEDIQNLLSRKHIELIGEIEAAEQRLLRLKSIKKLFLEDWSMEYQAIIKEIPEITVYYKQFKVHTFNDYGTIVPTIGAEISAANPDLKCAKPEYCYIEYLDGEYKEFDFNVAYVEAVEKEGKSTGDIVFKTMPKTTVACVLHKGSYDGLRSAYSYIIKWIELNGYSVAGNAREQYIDGCWNKSDEAEYLTEVQFPIVKK